MSGRGRQSNSPPQQGQRQIQLPNLVYQIAGQGPEEYSGYNQQIPNNYDINTSGKFAMQTGHPQQTQYNMYAQQRPQGMPAMGANSQPFYSNPSSQMRPRFSAPNNAQAMYMPNAQMGMYPQQVTLINANAVPFQMTQRMPGPTYSGAMSSNQSTMYPGVPPQTMPYQAHNPAVYFPQPQNTNRPPSAQPAAVVQKPARKGIPIIDPVSGEDITANLKPAKSEASTSDSSSRSTPVNVGEVSVSQPPAPQSPYGLNVAAQFAAQVAATLVTDKDHAHHPPDQQGAPHDFPHPQAPATAVDKTHVPSPVQMNIKSNTALPGLANGETPVTVLPNTLPAQHHTSVPDSSGGYSSKASSSKSDTALSKTVPAASQPAAIKQISAEPVLPASDSVHSVSALDTNKSAPMKAEATPEVRVMPPTPVEKNMPEIAEKPTISSEAKTAESIPGKKEKSKKKPRDINKRGEMIQGTEFDAYVDDTPHTQKEEPVEEEKPATSVSQPEPIVTSPVVIEPAVKPEVSVPAHKEAPTKVSVSAHKEAPTTVFKEPSPITITTKTAAEDVVPKVEISIEDAYESEHQDVVDDDLEEGEIRDEINEEDETAMLRYKYQEDQWSPMNPEGKKHYDREFLLQFQYESGAIIKPAGLPDIPDVILDKPISAGKSFIKVLPTGGPGADFTDFTPNYFWQGPQSGGGKQSRGMPRQPSNQKNKSSSVPTRHINLSIQKDIELHKAEKAWKPGHLEPKKEVENDEATEDLYKKTRSILNKLTPQKFQVLLSQMQALKIDTESKLQGVIDLVFEKAIGEPSFSVAYANMCRCLSMFKVQSDSKPNEMVNFRAVLLTRCQREFEKDKSSEAAFVTKREEIEKCEDAKMKEELKQTLDYEEMKAKRRSLGNIRFIGELFKLKMLTENIMHDCVFKLLRSKDPESLECLCRLLTTIGKELDSDKARPRMDQYFQQMDKIVNDKKNSARVRFMLQDVIDLRKSNWIARRADNNPKTIDQIHKEVAQENQEKAFLSQQNQMQNKQQGGGGRGGRRGPPSGQMGGQQGPDGWNMVGASRTPLKVDRSIDPSKMKISRQNVDDSIQLGPGGGAGRFAGWGRGSTGGTAGGRSSMEKEKQPQQNTPANRFSALSKPEEDSSRRMGGSSPARGDSRGGRGGFGRPNLSVQLSQEKEREKAVAATKAIVANQHQEENVSREGRGRGRGSSAEPRPTVVTPPPAFAPSNAKVLAQDEMEKKTRAILDEYFQIHDVKEAQDCVKEFADANHRHFVSSAMNHVLERSSQSRKQTGFLLHDLVKMQIITVDSYISGLLEVLEFAEDLEIDIPKIWNYYGEMISPMIQDGSVPLSFLKTAVGPLSQTNKAGVLLAEILHDASQREGHKKVAGLWTSSGLTWSDFVPRNQIEQFLQDKGLEFTKGGDSAPSTPTTGLPIPQISERLHELIAEKRLNNEAVFDWIESNVDEPTTKSKKFIRALMTAVCTSAIKGDKGKEKLEPKDLSSRNDLLQKYLDHQPESELQALYALQVLITRLEHPQGLLRGMFDILYDDDVISEDAFMQWEKSDEEPEGKGTALKQVVQFFTWLNEAEEDS